MTPPLDRNDRSAIDRNSGRSGGGVKILVVTLSNLGDAVLTLPVFEALSKTYPGAEFHAIAGSGAAMVFEGDPRIAKVTLFNKKSSFGEKLRFLAGVRREHYDVIVDLRYSLIGLLGGARRRNRYFRMPARIRHRALKHLSALEGLADTTLGASSFLAGRFAPESDTEDSRLVVAAVGSKSDLKKWPAASYARLLDRLALENGCRIALAGDKNDAADASKVAALMKTRPFDLAGRTDYAGLCSLIAGASLVVTNDSAPLHIADALGIPSVAIFGPTDPRKYGPRLDRSVVARRPLFCSPCEKAQCRYGTHDCMRELGVDEVYFKARKALDDEFCPHNLKILISRLDRIGDVVLSLPAVSAVRKRFPNATISLVVRPSVAPLVEGHPDIDEVIPYHYEKNGRHAGLRGGWHFLQEIVMRHFDAALILHPSTRAILVPFLAGIPYRVGLDSGPSFLLTSRTPDRRHEGLKHESEYALDIVRAFDAEPRERVFPSLPVHADEAADVVELLAAEGVSEREKIIAVHPGASCPSKRWPVERFAELSQRIIGLTGCRLVVIGGREEKELGRKLAGLIGPPAVDLTDRLDLRRLAAFLKRCDALVSNDSGPVHVAAAVGTRVLTIFGRSQPGLGMRRWRPLGEGHVALRKDVGCVVCLAHECPIEFECLKAVTVDAVFEAFKGMVSEEVAK